MRIDQLETTTLNLDFWEVTTVESAQVVKLSEEEYMMRFVETKTKLANTDWTIGHYDLIAQKIEDRRKLATPKDKTVTATIKPFGAKKLSIKAKEGMDIQIDSENLGINIRFDYSDSIGLHYVSIEKSGGHNGNPEDIKPLINFTNAYIKFGKERS